MRLAIVYHRPFYRDAAGGLWEAEGSFSRYVESLARRVDEVVLCAPRRERPFRSDAYRLAADNVVLYPLPFFDRLPRFYAGLPRMLVRLWRALPAWDVVNLRVPTPLGIYAFVLARLRRRPIFLLVVGDLAGVAVSVRVDSPKRVAYRVYLLIEEWLQDRMVSQVPTFVNGQALYRKYNRPERRVLVTTTSTISKADVRATAGDGLDRPEPLRAPIRILCVSRVDPRKGLRYLPRALAELVGRGHDARLRIVGPIVGKLGAEEQAAVLRGAVELRVADRIEFLGARTLPQVLDIAREHDLFVLPTLPGEGVPRVLVEAMAGGLPIVATDVAGVPTVISHEVNGLLVPSMRSEALADALDRLIRDDGLRARLIQNGYRVARAHTVDAHARKIVLGLAKVSDIKLRRAGGSQS